MDKNITKSNFVKRMSLIQNFRSEQQTLATLIYKISDGYPIVTFGDYLITEMINMINESLNIADIEFLSWWLYEDVDKVIYEKENKDDIKYSKEISVKTLDELFDYIVSDI